MVILLVRGWHGLENTMFFAVLILRPYRRKVGDGRWVSKTVLLVL
jgi:hypothetical protein